MFVRGEKLSVSAFDLFLYVDEGSRPMGTDSEIMFNCDVTHEKRTNKVT